MTFAVLLLSKEGALEEAAAGKGHAPGQLPAAVVRGIGGSGEGAKREIQTLLVDGRWGSQQTAAIRPSSTLAV